MKIDVTHKLYLFHKIYFAPLLNQTINYVAEIQIFHITYVLLTVMTCDAVQSVSAGPSGGDLSPSGFQWLLL